MKFELKISLIGELPNTYEMDGDLDAVKTFLKLKIDLKKFNWASIKRTDAGLVKGDVEYWSVTTDRHGEMVVHAFAFYEVSGHLNLNAMRRALSKQSTDKFDTLGEGTI